MASKPDTYECEPGYCVIINNMEFDGDIENLSGAGIKDEENLTFLFSTLKFKNEVYQNLKAEEMKSIVKEYSHLDHNKRAFFLIILSHGGKGDVVYGTDGGAVEVEQLKQLFHTTNCPTLAGVPKVFLIDACRGTIKEGSYPNHTKPKADLNLKRSSSTTSFTASSDFTTIFASTRGNVAFSCKELGSYLTQTFVEVVAGADVKKNFLGITRETAKRIQELQVAQTVEFQSTFTKEYYIKRNTNMSDFQSLQDKFTEAVCQWLPVRNRTIQDIKDTAEKLQEHHRNVNISRITGSTASIAGSAMAIVGFALTPVTLGASLGLSAAGISLAAAGGVTAGGASIVDMFIEKSNLEEVQKRIDRDLEEVKKIQRLAEKIEEIIKKIRYNCSGISAARFPSLFGEVFAHGTVRIGRVGIKITEIAVLGSLEIGGKALQVGGAAAKGIAGAALAFNIALIPIDLYEIVRSSRNLGTGSQTKAIEKLNVLVLELEDQKKSLRAQANI